MAVKVTKNELRWREWRLGEGEFRGKGAVSKPRPDVGFGGPGQKKIPGKWWERLEAFLAKRESKEPAPGPVPPQKPGMVSEHFNIREFDCHNGQKVPVAAIPAVARLCNQFLERMHDKFGTGYVMSGYRPRAYNAAIGGAKQSQHIYEDDPTTVAADTMWEKGTPQDWAAEARRISNELGLGGVGEYPPTSQRAGFVHIDNRRVIARWSG